MLLKACKTSPLLLLKFWQGLYLLMFIVKKKKIYL